MTDLSSFEIIRCFYKCTSKKFCSAENRTEQLIPFSILNTSLTPSLSSSSMSVKKRKIMEIYLNLENKKRRKKNSLKVLHISLLTYSLVHSEFPNLPAPKSTTTSKSMNKPTAEEREKCNKGDFVWNMKSKAKNLNIREKYPPTQKSFSLVSFILR